MFVSILAYWTYQAGKKSAIDGLNRDVALLASRFDALAPAGGRLAWLLAAAAGRGDRFSDDCDASAADILERFSGYSGILIYHDGALVCAAGAPFATDRPVAPAIAPGQTWAGLIESAAGAPIVAAAASAASQGSVATVVLAIHPQQIASLLAWFRSVESSRAQLVDRRGRTLGASSPAESATGEAPLETPPPDGSSVRTVSDAAGGTFITTTTRLKSADLWVVTRQREADVLAGARNQMALAMIAPVLTLLFAGCAVWFGLTRFVIRWVNRLILVTRAYGDGDLGARVGAAAAAPAEIRELARTFDGLADRMAERTVELEDEVLQKRRYIRELHHRVKNNLQVVASLLALQKRGLPEAQRAILRFPVDRVNAMAAAFGVSYAQSESGDVGALAVVREVIARLETGVESRRAAARISTSGEERGIALDTATGIAMLLAEILPSLFDAGAQADAVVAIHVALRDDTLTVAASAPPGARPARDRLSRRLLRAYLAQLNAQLSEPAAGAVELSIPLRPPEAPAGAF